MRPTHPEFGETQGLRIVRPPPPPSHPPTDAIHQTRALDLVSEIFEAYEPSIHCCQIPPLLCQWAEA